MGKKKHMDDLDQMPNQSWHTRMASVMRQFNSLAGSPVTDNVTGDRVEVIGFCKTSNGVRLTVMPYGDEAKAVSRDLIDVKL